MKQQDHWDYIMETLTTAFNKEYQYIKEHVAENYESGRMLEKQDDSKSLRVTRNNLICAIKSIYNHHTDYRPE